MFIKPITLLLYHQLSRVSTNVWRAKTHRKASEFLKQQKTTGEIVNKFNYTPVVWSFVEIQPGKKATRSISSIDDGGGANLAGDSLLHKFVAFKVPTDPFSENIIHLIIAMTNGRLDGWMTGWHGSCCCLPCDLSIGCGPPKKVDLLQYIIVFVGTTKNTWMQSRLMAGRWWQCMSAGRQKKSDGRCLGN